MGRRVQRNFGFGKDSTKFIYEGLDVLADDNAGILTKYQNGPGIDNKLRQTIGSSTSYFLSDHLGSTNGLADSTGALTSQTNYDSFGNSTNASFPGRYQFTGREFDNFSGLQFSRARFYDPNLGRFISEDLIGFRGLDINLYGYVKNKPLQRRDPSGLIDLGYGSPTGPAIPYSNFPPSACTCYSGGTLQIGFNFNFTYGIGNVNASYGLAFDVNGDVATYREAGGGAELGAIGSGVINVNVSNAPSIDDLGGRFHNGSVGLGDGPNVQANAFSSPDGRVSGGGLGFGPGVGGSASATETFTEIGEKYHLFNGPKCRR